MCTGLIKYIGLLILTITACRSVDKIHVLNGACQSRNLVVAQHDLLVVASYPWCKGCVEQISESLSAPIYQTIKPIYFCRNTILSQNPCAQNQTILESAKALFPHIDKLYLLNDSLAGLPANGGIHLHSYGKWLPHDSLFHGMYLDTMRLRHWLIGQTEK
jgi:hypothetical protein